MSFPDVVDVVKVGDMVVVEYPGITHIGEIVEINGVDANVNFEGTIISHQLQYFEYDQKLDAWRVCAPGMIGRN